MSSSDEYNRIQIAHTVLVGVLFIPSTVLFGCALCLGRRKNDPARRFTTFYKIALGLWTTFLFWDTLSYILYLVNIYVNDYFNVNTFPAVAQTADRTFYFGRLFECLSHLALFATLLELGFGILYSLFGEHGPMRRFARIATVAFVTLLAVLEITHFALAQSFYTALYGPDGTAFYNGRPSINAIERVLSGRKIFLAFLSLLFMAGVAVAIFAILVFSKGGKVKPLRVPATLYLVSALLWMFRNTWVVAEYGSWSGPDCYACSTYPIYIEAVDAVLNVWLTFTVMALLFTLSVRKTGGLWTTDPHSAGTVVTQVYPPAPPGYVYASQSPVAQQAPQPEVSSSQVSLHQTYVQGAAVPLEEVRVTGQTKDADGTAIKQ